jgi:hypothetical protein
MIKPISDLCDVLHRLQRRQFVDDSEYAKTLEDLEAAINAAHSALAPDDPSSDPTDDDPTDAG